MEDPKDLNEIRSSLKRLSEQFLAKTLSAEEYLRKTDEITYRYYQLQKPELHNFSKQP